MANQYTVPPTVHGAIWTRKKMGKFSVLLLFLLNGRDIMCRSGSSSWEREEKNLDFVLVLPTPTPRSKAFKCDPLLAIGFLAALASRITAGKTGEKFNFSFIEE